MPHKWTQLKGGRIWLYSNDYKQLVKQTQIVQIYECLLCSKLGESSQGTEVSELVVFLRCVLNQAVETYDDSLQGVFL